MLKYNVFRLKNHLLLMALAAVCPLNASAAGAARVDFAVGAVNVVAAGGGQRPASKGAELQSGETLVTGSAGRAQLRFSDGGMVSLQPDSEYRIDDYRFSGKEDGAEKGFFSLVKGGLRTITGQIGRSNKAAYRVKTSVATIGIRGTEFTIVYTGADSIAVATGEGEIEVCNNAGCVSMPSGTSAVISGPDTRIERSELRPRLDPAQPGDSTLAVFSSSDVRQEDGRIAPVSVPLPSGAGYAVAYVYRDDIASPPVTEVSQVSPTSAAFNEFSTLQRFVNDTDSFAAASVVGSFANGVLGWGRWSSGTITDTTSKAIADLHYVVGAPTSLAGLTGTVNFTSFGGTNATHRDQGTGVVTVGGVATGTMKVDFFTTPMAQIDLQIPINGANVGLNLTGIAVNTTNGTFNGAGTGAIVSGLFSGANAAFAGLTYRTEDSLAANIGLSNAPITGAVVFSRTD